MKRYELHRAVKAGNAFRVSELLSAPDAHVDINEPDPNGWTPLLHSVVSDEADVILLRTLLRHGARPDEENLMHCALGAGDPEKVKVLIEAGANVRYQDEHGYDALINAVHGRDVFRDPRLLELLKLLIASGTSLRGMSSYGESAVRVVSHLGRFDAVRLLLDAGANPDDVQLTPLIEAVAFGSLGDVEAKIASGADLEEREYWERTAWIIAIQSGDLAKAKLLRQRANVDAQGRCGRPALFYAIECRDLPMLAWLLEIGTDIGQKDHFGTTALRTAVDSGSLEGTRMLLEAGADVNEACASGTALNSASMREIAMLLLESGADPLELSNQGRRAILGYPPESDEGQLDVSAMEFQDGRSRRFGARNPEKMEIPFWTGMIRSGISAYQAGALFGNEHIGKKGYAPVWCAQRFGQSLTFLPDGRIVQVAGEHEDSYDPDFCIYNDAFVHEPDGKITIFGYPEAVFPPIDFHTATLVGDQIYLIGSLGYFGTRRYGETPVYRLDLNTFQITRLVTTGKNPGWIYQHMATLISAREIVITGGEVASLGGGKEIHTKNMCSFVLNLEHLNWRVV